MDHTFSYRQLLQQYQNISSLREKTRIEGELWELLSREQRRQFKNRVCFLKQTFGGSQNEYGNRQYLYNAADADVLWEHLERGTLKLETATRLHRAARRLAIERKTTVAVALEDVLAEYARLPKRADGTRVRNGMSRTAKLERANKSTRSFWSSLRKQIANHVRKNLPQGDVTDMETLWLQLETDIKVAIEDFQNKLRYTKKRTEAAQSSVSRREFREAFETLLLEPPRKNKPIDIDKVRGNKRKLARQYHPDMNAGDDDMRDAYEAVIEAALLIEDEYKKQKQEQEQKQEKI
jgi:curved DNA-binding protein CbpA